MQPVPKACLRHRLDCLPGTLGHEYKTTAFFLPNLYCSLPSSGRPPPPSISARAPSHSRAAAATSSRRRLFLSAALCSDLYSGPSPSAARNSSPILAVDPSASTLLPFPGPGEHPRVPLFPHDPPAPRFPHWNPSNTLRRRCAATPSRPHRRTPRSEPSRAQMSPQVDHVCRSCASEPNLRPNQALDR